MPARLHPEHARRLPARHGIDPVLARQGAQQPTRLPGGDASAGHGATLVARAAPAGAKRPFGLGAFAGANITPDKQTGIGNWSVEQIVAALKTGKRPDGQMLAPAMPWQSFAFLSKNDATAIAVFLKSVPAVQNRVAGPFAPGAIVTSFL